MNNSAELVGKETKEKRKRALSDRNKQIGKMK